VQSDPLDASDFELALSRERGEEAYFGRDVIRGLIDGIESFVGDFESKTRSARTYGTAMLACSPWFTHGGLLDAIAKLKGACVVVGKRAESREELRIVARMRKFNQANRGLRVRELSGLWYMELPDEDGGRRLIRPGDQEYSDHVLPTFRTVGHRATGDRSPQLMHAKLALLGHLWWYEDDEHGCGFIHGFRPKRLWVSSANFTWASRKHVEFGYWTRNAALMDGVHRFLIALIGASEDLDSSHDTPIPELVEAEYDVDAWAEMGADYVAEFGLPDPDDEDL
jgi:hypothetical protein